MIDVQIYEDNGLKARLFVTDPDFRADIDRIKQRVPFRDRDFVTDAEPKFWRIRNCEQYKDSLVEIGDALKVHKMQLRFL